MDLMSNHPQTWNIQVYEARNLICISLTTIRSASNDSTVASTTSNPICSYNFISSSCSLSSCWKTAGIAAGVGTIACLLWRPGLGRSWSSSLNSIPPIPWFFALTLTVVFPFFSVSFLPGGTIDSQLRQNLSTLKPLSPLPRTYRQRPFSNHRPGF
jgi:hypothetical protein